MPYISCVTPQKLKDEEKEKLKTEMGKLIGEIPGKSESWLFVGFRDGESLYFKGKKMEKAAIVEVKTFGTAEREHKDNLTAKLCSLLKRELDIPKELVYVIFYEVSDGNWGWNGALF